MVYVVEVENRNGEKATKEYNVRSFNELDRAMKRDLEDYPTFRVVDAWLKGLPDRSIFAADTHGTVATSRS